MVYTFDQKINRDGIEEENRFSYDLDAVGSIRLNIYKEPLKDDNGAIVIGNYEEFYQIAILYKYYNKVDTLHFKTAEECIRYHDDFIKVWKKFK